MATKAKKVLTLEEKAARCLQAEARGRKAYSLKDRLLGEIAREIEPGQVITLASGDKLILVDNFAKAKANPKFPNPTLWGMAGSRQFELEKIKG